MSTKKKKKTVQAFTPRNNTSNFHKSHATLLQKIFQQLLQCIHNIEALQSGKKELRIDRSSRSQMFFKTVVLKISQISQKNTCAGDLQACNFSKSFYCRCLLLHTPLKWVSCIKK